jgi:hypothetical protein
VRLYSFSLSSAFTLFVLTGTAACSSDSPPSPKTADSRGGSGGATSTGGSSGMATGGSSGSATGGSSGTATGGSSGSAAGGSSGTATGGAGGAPQAPTKWDGVVKNSPCPSLPSPGTWKRISPPQTDYMTSRTALPGAQFSPATTSMAVRPDDPAIVYVGGNKQGIFRTSDCGANWSIVNTGRNGDQLIAEGSAFSMAIDPEYPTVMYVVLGYGAPGLWRTTNGGVDWDQVLPPEILSAFPYNGYPAAIAIDPTNHEHLLLAPHLSSPTGICSSNGCLAESTDWGATWKLITTAPGFGENDGVVMLNRTTWLFCHWMGGLERTVDSGVTWDDVTPAGAQSASCNVYTPHTYRSASGTYYIPSQNGVLLGTNEGANWTLDPAPGRLTGIMETGTQVFGGFMWAPGFQVSPKTEPLRWSEFGPKQDGVPSDTGGVYMGYDSVHKVFYSSNFNGGLWQIVTD